MTNLAPDKKLGQHWLDDDAVLEGLCEEAALTAEDVVFEIGPGLGTLTGHLAGRARRVIALEFDERLAQEMRRRSITANVTILQGDILKFDLTTLPRPYKVVANLPYYITSKIVRLLMESPNPPERATLLVQKEVAQRMTARPGTMSVLAVAVQFYAHPHLGPIVPAVLFTPPPEVDSQIITLEHYPSPRFPDVKPADYFTLVKAGFGEKRKKLRNSLSGGLHLDKATVERLLKLSGIPDGARAEELDLEAWYRLSKKYMEIKRD